MDRGQTVIQPGETRVRRASVRTQNSLAVALDRQLLLMVSQLFDTCDDEVAKTHLDKIEGLIWLRNVDNVQPEPAKDKPRFAFIPQGFEFWMSLEVQMVAWKKGTK